MALTEDYKDFRAYELLDDGEKKEVPAEIPTLKQLLQSELVLLLVRYDLRRIFIWKGPRAPVRKRFISSRIGSQIQEDCAKSGMHMKIVSVDAGEEPAEFLKGFNTTSYEVKEGEKLQDMYYIRNDDRKKMEEAAQAAAAAPKSVQKEYVSPALGSQKDMEEAMRAREKAMAQSREAAMAQISNTPAQSPAPRKQDIVSTQDRTTGSIGPKGFNATEEKAILDDILKHKIPEGYKRLNIVIGTALYGPQKLVSKVFGKEVEKEVWDKISDIPEGNIDIDAGWLRVVAKNNQILGIEVYQKEDPSTETKNPAIKVENKEAPVKPSENPVNKSENKNDSKPQEKKIETGKRELKPIPKGE